MQQSFRRIIALIALALFFISAPLVIFYALGYRAGFQEKLTPQPVGVLSIETFPTRADVQVNGQIIGRSPEIVSGLMPGTVDVTVTKTGYQTWHKRLTIEPGRATEARDIILFPTNLTSTDLATNVTLFSLSPNRNLLVYANQAHQVSVIDQSGQEIISPLDVPGQIKSLLWSPDDLYVLVGLTSGKQYLLTIESTPALIQQDLPDNLDKITWDPHATGRAFWQSNTGSLYAFQVSNQVNAELQTDITSFATSNRYLYIVTPDNQLSALTLQGESTSLQIPSLPGQIKELHATPGGYLTIKLDNGSLWIWTGTKNWQKIVDQVQTFSWSPDEQLLLIAPDSYSLYVYNFDAERTGIAMQELSLITRLTHTIYNPQWFAGSRHLIYQIEDEIWVTEIDTRDYPQSYQIDTTNNGSSQITVGESGKYLYYLRESGANSTLTSSSLTLNSSESESAN